MAVQKYTRNAGRPARDCRIIFASLESPGRTVARSLCRRTRQARSIPKQNIAINGVDGPELAVSASHQLAQGRIELHPEMVLAGMRFVAVVVVAFGILDAR